MKKIIFLLFLISTMSVYSNPKVIYKGKNQHFNIVANKCDTLLNDNILSLCLSIHQHFYDDTVLSGAEIADKIKASDITIELTDRNVILIKHRSVIIKEITYMYKYIEDKELELKNNVSDIISIIIIQAILNKDQIIFDNEPENTINNTVLLISNNLQRKNS